MAQKLVTCMYGLDAELIENQDGVKEARLAERFQPTVLVYRGVR